MTTRADTAAPDNFDKITGFVEVVDEAGIHGWAYNKENPVEPATLEVRVDGISIGRAECSGYRPDVLAAGHPRAEVGFSLRIPIAYCDGQSHNYSFFADDVEVTLDSRDGARQTTRVFRLTRFFDSEFYVSFYREDIGDDAAGAFSHWRQNQHNHANLSELLASESAAGTPLPEDFSPTLYRFINETISTAMSTDLDAISHYLKRGRSDGLRYKVPDEQLLRDLYFGGKAPAAEDLALLLASGRARHVSVDGMLRHYGIQSTALLTRFSIADYVADNIEAELRTTPQCLLHFLEYGLPVLKSISFDLWFDKSFYRESNPELQALSDRELYRHWLNFGLDAGIAPNPVQYLRGLGLRGTADFPCGFRPEHYRAKNPELSGDIFRSRWSALKHFIEYGLAEKREGCPISTSTSEIYRVVADRLAIDGRLQSAKLLYEAVLSAAPENTLALRHYADCLLRLNEPYQASRIYEQTIALNKDIVWTHLNLSKCHVQGHRWADACRVMAGICERRPGDEGLKRAFRELRQQTFRAISEDAAWLARNKLYAESRSQTRTLYQIISPVSDSLDMSRYWGRVVGTVAIVADLGLPQCRFYRVDQKQEHLQSAGVESRIYDYTKDIASFVKAIPKIDAAIFYRVPATVDVLDAIQAARLAGILTFFEVDDLMFEDSEFPDSFESYGDQITHDLYATLITGTVALRASMQACDFAIASTEPLAAAMSRYVRQGRAFVHPNGLSSVHQQSYGRNRAIKLERTAVRIFYGSGTKAHNEDFEVELAPALATLFDNYGHKIELVIMGYLTLPSLLLPYEKYITVIEPIWDIQRYWDVLSSIDINIAVLKTNAVADAKSEIKWLEAAMFGIPSVVTATATYLQVLSHNVNAVLVRRRQEWLSGLDYLISTPAARTRIGDQAKLLALSKYSMEALSTNLIGIMNEAVGPKPEHNPKRLRILVVNVFFPPQSIGGATRVVADNIKHLVDKWPGDFEIEVFTTIEGGIEPYAERVYFWNHVKVHGVTTPSDPDIDMRVSDEGIRAAFCNVLSRFQPQLVHFHCIQRITPSVAEPLRARNIPYIVTVHDGWWISDEQFLVDDYGNWQLYDHRDILNQLRLFGPQSFDRFRTKREFIDGAALVIAVSEPFAEIYRSCGINHVTVIENGTSDVAFESRTRSANGRVRLAHIGGASFHKGYHSVRSALERGNLENLTLLVIDHALDPGVELSGVWGTTPVTFRGKYPQTDVAALYSQIDVLLAPSIWPESYGLVVREALAAGCWVIASNQGAVGKDVTPGVNGFVIDARSQDALYRVLRVIDLEPSKYLETPPASTVRYAHEQADELATLYRTFRAEALGAAKRAPGGDVQIDSHGSSGRKRLQIVGARARRTTRAGATGPADGQQVPA